MSNDHLGVPNGSATGTTPATGTDTGEARYLAADGRPVAAGDRFRDPKDAQKTYKVSSICNLFVYMDADGWAGPPRVIKRWKFAEKGFIRL